MLNTILLFGTYLLLSLLLIGLADKYILTQGFYDRNGQAFSGIPEMESAIYRSVRDLIYFYSAVYLLVKLLVIGMVIYTGLLYYEIRVAFSDVLRIVTIADFIFLVPAAAKIAWFYYYRPAATLEEWEQFYFLSAASYMPYIRTAYLYLLQTFNVFELGYWFLLAAGIRSLTGLNFDRSLRVVVTSYVPALLLWIVVVAFLTILYLPDTY